MEAYQVTTRYVYVDWTTEDVPRAFYVGKGCLKRVQKRERNAYWKRIADKYGWRREVILATRDEDFSFEQERHWIATLRTYHYDSGNWGCNFTRGGEGPSGYKHTSKSKDVIGQTHRGRIRTSAWCENIRQAKQGEKNPQAKLTSATVQAIRVRYEATRKLSQRDPRRVTLQQLAVEHGVTRWAIWRVVHEKVWKPTVT